MNLDFFKNIRNYKLANLLKIKLTNGVVHLKPNCRPKGRVLLSYITLPFITKDKILDGHTNRWECKEIAKIFMNHGYEIDVIDWDNRSFTPSKKYDYFFDIHQNMERLAPLLNQNCFKILHLTTSYWFFQNQAEDQRLANLKERRGVILKPRRHLQTSEAIKIADAVSMLGNDKTVSTYPKIDKKINLIPISTTHLYPSPEKKDFSEAKKNFIWFGGSGTVHKGLDLVLEAFNQTPELNLIVCGKINNEKDFEKTYFKELYQTSNISVVGLIDPGSEKFKSLIERSIAIVYPSSSEGQSGAVIITMHAGLIPIISEYSGVDVKNFGILLKDNTIDEIKQKIKNLANLPIEKLKIMAIEAWQSARYNHTREMFSKKYFSFLDSIIKNKT